MTSEIVIMNRNAIVMTADSVVTVENNKTHQGVDKLFMLSNHPSMGIMIFGSADFLNIPLETIIKEFKREIDIEKLENIDSIKHNFIDFISKFVSDDLYGDSINEFFIDFKDKINEKFLLMSQDDFYKFFNQYENEIILECFEDDNIDFNRLKNDFFNKGINLDIKLLKKAFSAYIKSFSTGIVIAGFNKNDAFPSISVFNLITYYKGKIIFEDSIFYSNYSGNAIFPFAQTDVITTFLSGIDEYFEFGIISYFDNKINSIFKNLREGIISNEEINGDALNNALKEINLVENIGEYGVNDFQNIISEMKKLNLSPIIESIGFLPKKDLANIAESLIYITSLKRKISNDLESVGGNIDVAIISKGDGFIWKKFEPYYDMNLNSHLNKD